MKRRILVALAGCLVSALCVLELRAQSQGQGPGATAPVAGLRRQIAHGTALTGRLRRCWSLIDDTAAAGHQAASDPVIAILLTLSRTTVVTGNAAGSIWRSRPDS